MDDRIPHRDARRSWFDEIAERTSNITSGAPFFAICIVLVVAWLPTLGIMGSEASQFLIQTITAIVTFLLVALLQNAEKRHQEAINIKLDAIAHGVADLMRERTGEENDLHDNIDRLVHTVGLEGRLSSRKERSPSRADAK
ncbi:MAG: low affinity iron permease family protein [Actinobacteria bacterium]|nr:low affinity iron permease family protein [Actinomycetota bacterium]